MIMIILMMIRLTLDWFWNWVLKINRNATRLILEWGFENQSKISGLTLDWLWTDFGLILEWGFENQRTAMDWLWTDFGLILERGFENQRTDVGLVVDWFWTDFGMGFRKSADWRGTGLGLILDWFWNRVSKISGLLWTLKTWQLQWKHLVLSTSHELDGVIDYWNIDMYEFELLIDQIFKQSNGLRIRWGSQKEQDCATTDGAFATVS